MRRRVDLQLFAGEGQLPASPRKRRRARERGEVPRSGELTAAAVLLAGIAVLGVAGTRAAEAFDRLLVRSLAAWGQGDLSAGEAVGQLVAAGWAALAAAGPLMVAVAAASVAVGVVQTGGLWTAAPLRPRWDRLDPVQGLRRLFSTRALAELVKALLKLGVLAAAVYGPLREDGGRLLAAADAPPERLAAEVAAAAGRLLWRAAAVALLVGLLDYAYQRWQYERSLAMTPHELKEEQRETEGDPTTRGRLRRRQREIARRRMLLEVRRADVVITNPVHVAVALRYDPATMAAPVVVAKGRDHMARLIRALARRYGVLWVEDRFLARALYASAEVGQPIPESLYRAVAEVLAFVWRLRGRSVRELLGAGPGGDRG